MLVTILTLLQVASGLNPAAGNTVGPVYSGEEVSLRIFSPAIYTREIVSISRADIE